MFNTIRKKADVIILIAVGVLIIVGLAILSSASSMTSMKKYDYSYFFILQQMKNIGLGLIAFLAARFTPVKWIKNLSYVFLIISAVLLVMIFTPLAGGYGTASRWLEIGGFHFQPSETLKITFILAMAAFLSNKKLDTKNDWKQGFLPFLAGAGIISVLLYLQPTTSMIVIVMGAACIMYFVHGMNWKFILVILGLVAIAASFLMNGYRGDRIAVFKGANTDVRGKSYHSVQAEKAIISGGTFGVGYGQSTVKNRLPAVENDSIFAVMAEEFGFIGSMLFISLYAVIVMAGFLGSLDAKTEFGRLGIIGLSSVVGLQSLINIAAISGAMPLTGVPLPFVSYGGTAIIIAIASVGLVINFLKNA